MFQVLQLNFLKVAGTFTVLSLVIVGFLGAILILHVKKRRASRGLEYLEKYPEPAVSSHRDADGTASPGPSTVDLHQAPMNPFSQQDPYYSDAQPQHVNDSSYHDPYYNTIDPVTHDPFASAADAAPAAVSYKYNHNPFANSAPSQYSLAPTTALSPGHPYHTASSKLAPVSHRPVERPNSYQPSIDSFYGASGQAQ